MCLFQMWIRWYNNDCVSLVQENHLKPLLFGCGQTLKYKSKNRKLVLKYFYIESIAISHCVYL